MPPAAATLGQPIYRSDIDGLRAIAVLAVVAFHAFPNLVTGGFVGVDVFFVISGYLISGVLIKDMNRGTFSFRTFYYRRIRRIFPALLIVMVACILIGFRILQVEEFKKLGSHVVSAALFISNFKYWNEAGYFDTVSETKPLLHLWSLGVEEQFYAIWPLLAWAASKVRLSVLPLAVIIAVPSFLYNLTEIQQHQLASAFFSPATRFWEIMLGAAIAGDYLKLSSTWRRLLSVGGFAAVIAAMLLINKDVAFPGWWALLPTLGTALVVGAGPATWLNRKLSHPLLVGVGLISYPLYLWHWPLLSFAWIVEGKTPTVGVRLAAIFLAVILASLTYQLVERPIRRIHSSRLIVGAALTAFMLSLGAIGYEMRGGRITITGERTLVNAGETVTEDGHELFFKYQIEHFYPCNPVVIHKDTLPPWPPRCQQSKPGEIKQIAIVGDSHAEDLFIGLAESLPDLNVVKYIQNSWPGRSTTLFDEIFSYIEHDPDIRVVILAAYWQFRKKDVPKDSNFEAELSKTVEELTRYGKLVYLIDDRPEFPFDASVCKYLRPRFFWQPAQREPRCSMERALFEQQRSQYYPTLQAVAAKFPDVKLIDTSNSFCDERICKMADSHILDFRDTTHLTIAGSRVLGKWLATQISLP